MLQLGYGDRRCRRSHAQIYSVQEAPLQYFRSQALHIGSDWDRANWKLMLCESEYDPSKYDGDQEARQLRRSQQACVSACPNAESQFPKAWGFKMHPMLRRKKVGEAVEKWAGQAFRDSEKEASCVEEPPFFFFNTRMLVYAEACVFGYFVGYFHSSPSFFFYSFNPLTPYKREKRI